MKYKITAIAAIVLMISGCGSTKIIKIEEPKEIAADMLKEGFLEGVIVFSEAEGDCAYTIKTNGDVPEYLDPTNLDEKYNIDGQQVWVKYSSLRIPNRCDKARPVEIVDIRLREK